MVKNSLLDMFNKPGAQSDTKENVSTTKCADASLVKPEPQEPHLPTLSSHSQPRLVVNNAAVKMENQDTAHAQLLNRDPPVSSSTPNMQLASTASTNTTVKGEDIEMKDASLATLSTSGPSVQPIYTVYKSTYDIAYVPEDALKEGLGMVKTLKSNIKKLELGSKLRKDVWLREIESLQNQGAPTTMIAICGATGAGKSSILNAILDDNIVPTSGMRACTAVVTEIGYHPKNTIEADVSFLSEQEWREELKVLLDDLVDEDGNLKRSTDLRSDAGVAWQKVHAVYPNATQEQLVKTTVDQIISREPHIARILGTAKHIVTNDSKSFSKEIGKYIDSKDQKRGDKKDKKTTKPKKDGGKSLIEKLREQNRKNDVEHGSSRSAAKGKDNDDDPDGPAFWPLIRQVRVKCNAWALSAGAILVDLPGVADANAARNNIAKDYMKKCDCVWILAPITRAVDDKTARDLMGDAFKMQLMMDGNYDANAITFIATKCDDISCSEVIRSLNLEDDPELEVIESEIESCKNDHDEWKDKKKEAETLAKDIDTELKRLRPILQEYKDHLKALQNGETFEPQLTGQGANKMPEGVHSKKRKNTRDAGGRSTKRRKNSDEEEVERGVGMESDDDDDDDDSFIVDDDEDDDATLDSISEGDKSPGEDRSDSDEESGEDSDEQDDGDDDEEEVTEENLQKHIEENQANISEFRVQLSEQRRLRKEAIDALANIKKRQIKAQREKNAFCSKKRSEFSRDVLKEDFRVGLKDLDDAAAEERNPDAFDPTVNLRNYEEIDLPVFTCSARDYVRIKGQVKGDGDPSCFSKVEDTGVPDLQKWCHHLTASSRERAARNFLTHLKTFANSVKTYVEGIGDVTEADRESLREKWESNMPEDDNNSEYDILGGANRASSDDGFNIPFLDRLDGAIYTMNQKAPKVDRFGKLIGVTPRLVGDFMKVVDDCVSNMQRLFRDGLEERCRMGAVQAAAASLDTSDAFAASMHWATYRATLRRHGSWRQDLNVELSNPFTRQIASTWSKVFEADLFADFEKATNAAISAVITAIEECAAQGLKERARSQGEVALEEAKVALQKTLQTVQETINNEQKEISRCLAPHVQEQLHDSYDRAMEERGLGSVARQKAVFHNIVADIKDEMFEGAADIIMVRLAKAAEAVGKALEVALSDLAEKVEVSIAVLWEGPRDDPQHVKTRTEVVTSVVQLLQQIEYWQEAARGRHISTTAMS